MGMKVAILVVLWAMSLATVVVLNALGVIIIQTDGTVFGFTIKAGGAAALMVAMLLILLYILGKIPTAAANLRSMLSLE